MKNYFRKSFVMLFMALACASLAFVACGDDDDENGNGGQNNPPAQQDQTGLVGTWKGHEDGDSYIVTICFNANYTGWDDWDGEKDEFTWYTEGNKLVFVYPEEDNADYDVDEYIYKIAGNQLYLYELDSQTGEQELENVLTRQ
ncbi:MAG: hypothetical protein ACOCNS_06900 [Bacteroidales bacterium]